MVRKVQRKSGRQVMSRKRWVNVRKPAHQKKTVESKKTGGLPRQQFYTPLGSKHYRDPLLR